MRTLRPLLPKQLRSSKSSWTEPELRCLGPLEMKFGDSLLHFAPVFRLLCFINERNLSLFIWGGVVFFKAPFFWVWPLDDNLVWNLLRLPVCFQQFTESSMSTSWTSSPAPADLDSCLVIGSAASEAMSSRDVQLHMCQSDVPFKVQVVLVVESGFHAKAWSFDVGTVGSWLRYGAVETFPTFAASNVRRFAELRKNTEGDVVLCATGRVKLYEIRQTVGSKASWYVPVGFLEVKKWQEPTFFRPQIRVAGSYHQLGCFRQALLNLRLFKVNFEKVSIGMIEVTLLPESSLATVGVCGFSRFSGAVFFQRDTGGVPPTAGSCVVHRGPTRLQMSGACLLDAPWFEATYARKREDVSNKFFHEGKVLHLTVVSGVFLQEDLISSGAITWCSGYQLMLISSNLLIKCSDKSWSFFSSLEFLQLPKCRPQQQPQTRTPFRWLRGDFVEKPKGPTRSDPRWCGGAAKKESNSNARCHVIQAVLPFRHGCHPSMPSFHGDPWSESLPLFSKAAERPQCPFLCSSRVLPKAPWGRVGYGCPKKVAVKAQLCFFRDRWGGGMTGLRSWKIQSFCGL